MVPKLILILLVHHFIIFHVAFCSKYTNYTLLRAIPADNSHLRYFAKLTDIYDVNFWRPPGSLARPVEFSIGPDQLQDFYKDAELRNIYLTTINNDIQRMFDDQAVVPYVRRNMETFNWSSFYRLNDIYNWLYDLQNLYPRVVTVESIGKSLEGRDILAVKVILPQSSRRSKVIIEGGIHAREWIAPAFVTYLLNEIVHASTSNNPKLKKIAMTYEWYFVPVLNPDGYELTHIKDRLWRKNARGVDLNRNFDSGFGSEGVSTDKNSEIYCGERAFSEPESRAMAKYVESKSENLEYYIGFHCYGQYMILPYAHKKEHCENYDEVSKKCAKAADAISKRFGTLYKTGTAYETVGYLSSGISAFWVKKTYKTPYVVIFELRDEGKYGFGMPSDQITPTCLETMDGLTTLMRPDENTKDIFVKPLKKHDPEKIKPNAAHGRNDFDKVTLLFNALFFAVIKY